MDSAPPLDTTCRACRELLRAMHAKALLFRKAAMALLNSQLFRAYNAWHELAEDNKRTAEKIRRVLVRLDPVCMLLAS